MNKTMRFVFTSGKHYAGTITISEMDDAAYARKLAHSILVSRKPQWGGKELKSIMWTKHNRDWVRVCTTTVPAGSEVWHKDEKGGWIWS